MEIFHRKVSRRDFLKGSAGVFAGVAATTLLGKFNYLEAQENIDTDNPLDYYPDRDWETVYRDQYRTDRTFSFVCAPNDTHCCRLRAHVRNGVVVRIEQSYDVGTYQDLYGNKATTNWNPRGCLKGLSFMRRLYSHARIKYPTMRRGFIDWVDAGFPRGSDGKPDAEKYFKRGQDTWVKVSWADAWEYTAKAMVNIASTYNGQQGHDYLAAQGYSEDMLDTLKDEDGDYSGMRTFKLRGGMAFLGATRLTGCYRFGNMLSLLDDHLRGKGAAKSMGARLWDNYAWHTDLPPGHPMVHGVQTFDQEFHDFENSDLIVMTGLNLVSNKMADPIWWQSAIERKKKIVVIAPEYSASSPKADYWLSIRPGSDAALMLSIAHILIRENKYDADFVKKFSDYPLLVRTDTGKMLRREDLAVAPTYLDPGVTWKDGKGNPVSEIDESLKTNGVMRSSKLVDGANFFAVSRSAVGDELTTVLAGAGLNLGDIELDWTGTVQTANGPVTVRTVFNLYKELTEEYTPANGESLTWIPEAKIRLLANDIAAANAVAFVTGMGLNMYFNNDLVGRAYYIVAILTGNVGKPGGNVGSYAGNYKTPTFNGLPAYTVEDPFSPNLDPSTDGRDVNRKSYCKYESVHFWDYGDKPLVVDHQTKGKVQMTGPGHMPSPTKVGWVVNANQIGVGKWHYNLIANVLPKQELYIAQDLEWNMTCEYSDVVFPVDTWCELKYPDMTASCTNPFVQIFPRGGIARIHDSKQDIEVYAGLAGALKDITGDSRFTDYWKFVDSDMVEVYLQRIIDGSNALRGYNVYDMLEADRGFLTMWRTYPRIPGYEQIQESKPFYTKTGRMELYREEDRWISQGENLVVHREPIEATIHQPRVIVAPPGLVNPEDYGTADSDTTPEGKSVYNKVMTTQNLLNTQNPLSTQQGLNFVLITPKPRHRVHSSWGAADWTQIMASNFGDPYRMDKRTPWVGEEEMDMSPLDAAEMGINDGDYVWVDANKEDRPYVGADQPGASADPLHEVSRLMIRVKFNPSLPRKHLIIIHGLNGATHASVQAQKTNPDGSAKTEQGYSSAVRFGSQQSVVRGWIQPTQMTETLAHKDYFTQDVKVGFQVDTHTPTGCPKEVLVKVTFAEKGGLNAEGAWAPGTTGYTPGNENDTMKKFLAGGFIE